MPWLIVLEVSMAQEPIDRREHVHVDATSTGVVEQRVVHDPAAEERLVLERVTQFIWLIAAVLELAILIRVFLKLLAANPNSPFAQLIYGVTDLFLFPFFGLTATPTIGGAVLEIPALIAMFVYFIAFWVLTRLIWLVFERPTARTVSTYEARQATPVERVVERQVVHEQPVVEQHIIHEEPVVRETRVVREQPVIEERVIVEKPTEHETIIRRPNRNNDTVE
jgi:hypothetical protein